jgi:hypothetical protein
MARYNYYGGVPMSEIEVFSIEHHPNESPRDGTIHPIALAQLSRRQELAQDWRLYADPFDGDVFIRCGKCDLAVYQLVKYNRIRGEQEYFTYEPEEKNAMTVAHIANHHPEVYSGIE